MTTDLRERLDDLLAGVPDHLTPPDPAASWRAGARRRVRRRVTVGASLAAVVALVAGGLVGARVVEVQPADGGSKGSTGPVTSYPVRIDQPLRQGDLPAHPGPIAGVVDRPDGWYAVSPNGALWRIIGSDPDFLATVSPDGTRLAYLNTRGGSHEWGIEDLRTGEWTTNDVGASGSGSAWTLAPHTPTSWSPDSRRLLVPATVSDVNRPLPGRRPVAVVLDGLTLWTVMAPSGHHVVLVGWLSDHRLGWLRWRGSDPAPEVLVTSAAGNRVLRRAPAPAAIPRQRFVSATPGLRTDARSAMGLLVTTTDRDFYISNPGQRANTALVGSRQVPQVRVSSCPVSWGQSQPWTPVERSSDDGVLTSLAGSTLIQADPRLHLGCSVWASTALDGTGHGGLGASLFGADTSWLSWHWREVALGSALGMALLGAALLVVRRRRRWAVRVETKS